MQVKPHFAIVLLGAAPNTPIIFSKLATLQAKFLKQNIKMV